MSAMPNAVQTSDTSPDDQALYLHSVVEAFKAAGKQADAITDASTAHAGTAPAALADAMLRTEIVAALDALGSTLNSVIAALEKAKIIAT